MKPDSFLIIKQSSLGDVAHTLPLVHCLKRHYPESRIGWVVQQGFVPLLQRELVVDSIYPIDIPSTSEPGAGRLVYFKALLATVKTLNKLREQLQQRPYQYVLDLHASFRSGILALCNPGGRRIGFNDARELNTWFQHEKIAVPGRDIHAMDKNLLFAGHLHCKVEKEDFHIHSSNEDKKVVQAFLSEIGMGNMPLVYIAATARWQTKFWQQEKWVRLADALFQKGLRPIFGGGREDRSYLEPILRQITEKVAVDAVGKLSLPETVALMQRCCLYIGLDTGPMHLAALVGLPVAALFGPTHPERVGPYGVAHRIIRSESADCLGCRKRKCRTMHCMQNISVDQVLSTSLGLLEDQRV